MQALVNRSRYYTLLASIVGATVVAHTYVFLASNTIGQPQTTITNLQDLVTLAGGIRQVWWPLAGSGLTILGLFVLVFERFLWRWPVFRWHKWLIQLPDMTGTWTGTSTGYAFGPDSSSAPQPIKQNIIINVRHDFHNIHVRTYNFNPRDPEVVASVNESSAAMLCQVPGGGVELLVVYRNHPEYPPATQGRDHNGSYRVVMHADEVSPNASLVGDYWTDKARISGGDDSSRGTFGRLGVAYAQHKLYTPPPVSNEPRPSL